MESVVEAQRGGTPTPKTAPVQPGVAGAPEAWWRIAYDNKQADLWSCQYQKGNQPLDFMRLADLEYHSYRMEDVTEGGQVVQTMMVERTRGGFAAQPPPLEGYITWYRGKARCEQALQAFRVEAQRERQRRERYR
jgi:hypothetical protein